MFRYHNGGYSGSCKSCTLEYLKTKVRNPLARKIDKKLDKYRGRDKKHGHVFNLTNKWYRENILNKPCYYCGKPAVGCDRLDNNQGHTITNCVPCCHRCNVIRNVYFTPEQMLKLAKYIVEFIDK